MPQTSPLRGALLMVAFCVMAPLLDACSKLATEMIPVGQITAARFLFQGLCMAPVFAVMRPKWGGTKRDLGFMLARAACLICSTYCFVAAVQYMPIADAIAIVFVMPFMIMGLARLIFGTPIGRTQMLASLVGFGGALLVIQPSLSAYGLVALFPLGCALAFSFYEFATQAMSTRVDPVSMQLYTSVAGIAIAAPVLWAFDGSGVTELDPVLPDAINLAWLFGVGFWAATSHFCMTLAMRHAPASTLAPLHYLELPMAVFLGYAIFGDFPNALTWVGMVIIVGSGLYVIRHEHRSARTQPPLLPDEAI